MLAVLAVEAEDLELRRAQHVRRGVLPAGAEDDAAADEQHQPFRVSRTRKPVPASGWPSLCEERKKSPSLL